MAKNFRELYCARCRIEAKDFEQHLFLRALYPSARLLHRLLSEESRRRNFELDFEFVRAVGLLHSRRAFRDESSEFARDPANRGFLRQVLRLRVSGQRVRAIVDEIMEESHSRPPV